MTTPIGAPPASSSVGGAVTPQSTNPVVQAIMSIIPPNEPLVREAMLLGSDLESGWNTNAVGDRGTSFGPFQMHIGGALTSAHGTPQQAEDPQWAVNAMRGAYEQAVNAVPESVWSSNPELGAEEAAVGAERPATSYYNSQGAATVDAKWKQVLSVMQGNWPTGQGAVVTPAVNSITDMYSQVYNQVAVPLMHFAQDMNKIWTDFILKLFLPKTWARVGCFWMGCVLIMIGLYLFFSKPGAMSRSLNNIAGTISKAGMVAVK